MSRIEIPQIKPKYLSASLRQAMARLYLAIKLPSLLSDTHQFDALVQKLSIRMGKKTPFRNHVWGFVTGAIQTNDDSTTQAPRGVDEEGTNAHHVETGYDGHAGQDLTATAETPYEEGVTSGFTLFGVGMGWQAQALNGCPECYGIKRGRGERAKVYHTADCQEADNPDFEPTWFENPALDAQDGEYIQYNDMSLLARISQEEDEIRPRSTNAKPCTNPKHIEIEFTDIYGSNRIRYMVRARQELRPCLTCFGTGTKFPVCRMCEGKTIIEYGEIEQQGSELFRNVTHYNKCPLCSRTRGRLVNVTSGATGPANKDQQDALKNQMEEDAEYTEIGEDFVEFASNAMNVINVTQLFVANQRMIERKKALIEMGEMGALNHHELKELQSLKEVHYMSDLDCWRQVLMDNVESGKVTFDWMTVIAGEIVEGTSPFKLEALNRILQWCLNPTGEATAGCIGREEEEIRGILPENANQGTPWGPYLLSRELGDAELMVHTVGDEWGSRWDVYDLNEDPYTINRMDTVQGYNPGRAQSRHAAQANEIDFVRNEIFPLVTNKDSTFEDFLTMALSMRESRRPRQITVKELLGNEPKFTKQPKDMSFMGSPLFRGQSKEFGQVVGFEMGERFMRLKQVKDPVKVGAIKEHAKVRYENSEWNRNRYVKEEIFKLPGQWTVNIVQDLKGRDGVSCWRTNNLPENGMNAALALMGASMLGRPRWRKQLMDNQTSGAEALRNMATNPKKLSKDARKAFIGPHPVKTWADFKALARSRADAYEVMSLLYQWLPPDTTVTDRLPELSYLKYEPEGINSGTWETVPSRLTHGAFNKFAKTWCKEHKVRWTSIEEPRGRYSIWHTMAADPNQQKLLMQDRGIWENKQERNRFIALDQFTERMAASGSFWRMAITSWLKENKAIRKETGKLKVTHYHGVDGKQSTPSKPKGFCTTTETIDQRIDSLLANIDNKVIDTVMHFKAAKLPIDAPQINKSLATHSESQTIEVVSWPWSDRNRAPAGAILIRG